ncbi:hypothetical protein [Aeromicrobium sp. UC242_57]|uniref:hypothetical protein n=1 Tax=Aeromicrobium sp. UC242_57 TaxID=3374624 RepID=UPI0037BE240A
MLVPQIAPGTSQELGDLRQACDEAVQTLMAEGPDRIVVIGSGRLAEDLDDSAGGTLAAYGVDVHAGGTDHQLPLSLTIGAWLLDRAGWTGPRTYSTGAPSVDGRTALLVMADVSARRSLQAPGFLDERAESFDAAISAALAAGDAERLASLDSALGEELMAAGVEPLRSLGQLAKGADIVAQLRYDAAPLGVGYIVADWVLS